MDSVYLLKIYAADGVFYEGMAKSLTIPATDGEMQILAHHASMVVATKEGIIRFTDGEGTEHKGIAGIGFVHITSSEVVLLADTIELPEDIDRARAERALARAQEQLRQDQSIQEYHLSRASLARAMMRLSVASGGGKGIGESNL